MLDKLQGCFWTDLDEMVQEFTEETGYDVLIATQTFVVLEGGEDDEQIYIELVKAGKTMAIHEVKVFKGGEDDDELY